MLFTPYIFVATVLLSFTVYLPGAASLLWVGVSTKDSGWLWHGLAWIVGMALTGGMLLTLMVFGLFTQTAVIIWTLMSAGAAVYQYRRMLGAEGGTLGSESLRPDRTTTFLVIAVALLTALPLLPFGMEVAGGVSVMHWSDWAKHLMFSSAVANQDAFPLANPFYHTQAPFAYYMGAYVPAAAVAKLTAGWIAVSLTLPLTAVVTSGAWAGVVYILGSSIWKRRAAGNLALVLATIAGGFDLFVQTASVLSSWVELGAPLPPSLGQIAHIIPSLGIDDWALISNRFIQIPATSAMGVPQHIAGLACAFTGFGLWYFALEGRGRRLPLTLLAGAVLGSVLLMSAQVAVGVVLWFGVAMLLRLYQHGWKDEVVKSVLWLLPAALVIALPFALAMHSATTHMGGPQLWLPGSPSLEGGGLFATLFGSSISGSSSWTGLLDTPAYYAIEFGFVALFGVAGTVAYRKSVKENGWAQQMLLVGIFVVLVAGLFLRSPQSQYNDLFTRTMSLVWVALSLFAGALTIDGSWSKKLKVSLSNFLPIITIGAVALAGLSVVAVITTPPHERIHTVLKLWWIAGLCLAVVGSWIVRRWRLFTPRLGRNIVWSMLGLAVIVGPAGALILTAGSFVRFKSDSRHVAAYEWINRNTPASAVVQSQIVEQDLWVRTGPAALFYPMYVSQSYFCYRSSAYTGTKLQRVYTADSALTILTFEKLRRSFSLSAEEALPLFQSLEISHIVVDTRTEIGERAAAHFSGAYGFEEVYGQQGCLVYSVDKLLGG